MVDHDSATAPGGARRLRLSPAGYRRITAWALASLCFIIVTGAAVRLTGSGLGCPDWPTCYQDQFHAEWSLHPMIEWVNRLITGVVSVAVILAVLGSLLRVPRRRDLTWLSLGLVAGVIAQIVIGAAVVLLHLQPVSVIAHFLASMVLVWNAVVLHHRAAVPERTKLVPTVDPVTARWVRLLPFLAAVVLVTGTVVTGSGPHGGDTRAERLGFDIGQVTRLHSVTVWVLLAATLWTLRRLHRGGPSPASRTAAAGLTASIGMQGVIGYTQYFSGVPAALVAAHVVGSIAVWIAVLRLDLSTRAPARSATVASGDQSLRPVLAD